LIEISKEANLPTKMGHFKIKIYKEAEKEHCVIYTDSLGDKPLVRIHSECLTGDVLSSMKCDCQDQLHQAMKDIKKDKGAILYLRQEGRGIGLLNKINAYHYQDKGMNTIEANKHIGFDADIRDYAIVEFILNDLKITKVNLMTNNPDKLKVIENISSITEVSRTPIITQVNNFNKEYLDVKRDGMGHLL
jgi:GTP cyclohydrolase II